MQNLCRTFTKVLHKFCDYISDESQTPVFYGNNYLLLSKYCKNI